MTHELKDPEQAFDDDAKRLRDILLPTAALKPLVLKLNLPFEDPLS